MTAVELRRLKLMLEDRLKELASSLRNRGDIAVERTPDVLDGVELAGERDLAIRSLDKSFVQLRLVETALARIAHRTYGYCLRCDAEISMRRLTAVPHAVFCLKCQEETDHDGSRITMLMPGPGAAPWGAGLGSTLMLGDQHHGNFGKS